MSKSLLESGADGLATLGTWESYGKLFLSVIICLIMFGIGMYFIFTNKEIEYTEIKKDEQGKDISTPKKSGSRTIGIILSVVGILILAGGVINYLLTKHSKIYATYQGANNFF
jgi:H+/gluconate symporter-like permease